MILIQNENIDNIKKCHYDAIQPYSLAMLKLYIAFFDVIANDKKQIKNSEGKIEVLSNSYLHHSTIYACVKPLFHMSVKEDDITWHVLETILQTGSSSLNLSFAKKEAQKLSDLFNNLLINLDRILIGSPEKLQDMMDEKIFLFPKDSLELKIISWVFNYKRFRKDGFKFNDKNWDAYSLTTELDLSVCPYCNRNWIVTVTNETEEGTNKKIVNPQLDHFFSQEEQPQFAISFYNLIPSCEACNARLKKSVQFNYHAYLHPYMDSYGNNSMFLTTPKDLNSQQGKGNNFIVNLSHTKMVNPELKLKIDKNHSIFQIESIYEQHGDVISDLYRKKFLYSYDYINTLQSAINEYKFNPDEIYRVAFGNYYFEKDFSKRPFAKLTRDVIDNLGLFQID